MKNKNTDKVLNVNASDKHSTNVYMVMLVDAANMCGLRTTMYNSKDRAKDGAMELLRNLIRAMPKYSYIQCFRNKSGAVEFILADKSHAMMYVFTYHGLIVGKSITKDEVLSDQNYDNWVKSLPQLPEGFEDIDVEKAVSVCLDEGWCIASTENGLVLGEGVTEREFPRRA